MPNAEYFFSEHFLKIQHQNTFLETSMATPSPKILNLQAELTSLHNILKILLIEYGLDTTSVEALVIFNKP